VAADFEILGNSKLLGQVINWRKGGSSQGTGLDLGSGSSNTAPPRAADDAGNGGSSNSSNNN
jgi:hypothetical protein